ncbi:hypothetical protein, partial [Paenibacillus pseudetheri]|uniref:hypothetical protein n=1 Tax=Paenibacillus pseudetheri TaxID=2897682 RepID=UPI001F3CFCD4
TCNFTFKEAGLLLDIRKTPIIVAVEIFVFSTVYYDGSISLPHLTSFMNLISISMFCPSSSLANAL